MRILTTILQLLWLKKKITKYEILLDNFKIKISKMELLCVDRTILLNDKHEIITIIFCFEKNYHHYNTTLFSLIQKSVIETMLKMHLITNFKNNFFFFKKNSSVFLTTFIFIHAQLFDGPISSMLELY